MDVGDFFFSRNDVSGNIRRNETECGDQMLSYEGVAEDNPVIMISFYTLCVVCVCLYRCVNNTRLFHSKVYAYIIYGIRKIAYN